MKRLLCLVMGVVGVYGAAPVVPVPTGPESPYTKTLKPLTNVVEWQKALLENKAIPFGITIEPENSGTNWAENFFIEDGFSVGRQFLDIRTTGAQITAADHTTAIQAAINAADGMPVRIPDGDWQVGSLTITEDTQLEGSEKARLNHLPATAEAMIVVSGTTKLTIKGLTLNGNAAARSAFDTNIVNLTSIISTRSHNSSLEVRNTVFTNSQRAAISLAGPAWIYDSKFYNIKTNACIGNGTPGNTFGIYAQPSGYNPNMHLQVEGCEFIGQTGHDTNLVYLAARGIWVSEQANNADLTLNTNRYTLTVRGNRFVGLGGWFHSTEGGAIEVYNGCNSPIIEGNLIECYGHAGIQIQRTGNAIIRGNQIKDGFNNYSGLSGIYRGNSKAILFEPEAREGAYPFQVGGGRTGETHRGAIIEGNYIKNFQQNGVYAKGRGVIIKANVFDRQIQTFPNSPPATISIQADDIDIDGNFFLDIPNYAAACTGPYTNIWIRNNRALNPSVTNTSGFFVFQHARNVTFENNYASFSTNGSATFLYIDKATNFVSRANKVDLNGGSSQALGLANADTVPQVTQLNDAWAPDSFRRAWSGLTYDSVLNLDTSLNTLAGAGRRLQTIDSGGGLFAYPWNYAGTADQGRLSLIPDTTASGVNVNLHEGTNAWQDFRINFGVNNKFYVANSAMRYQGGDPIPLVIDTTNRTQNLIKLQLDGTNKTYFGYQGSTDAFVVVDKGGGNVNLTLFDSGPASFRSTVTAAGLTLSTNASTYAQAGLSASGDPYFQLFEPGSGNTTTFTQAGGIGLLTSDSTLNVSAGGGGLIMTGSAFDWANNAGGLHRIYGYVGEGGASSTLQLSHTGTNGVARINSTSSGAEAGVPRSIAFSLGGTNRMTVGAATIVLGPDINGRSWTMASHLWPNDANQDIGTSLNPVNDVYTREIILTPSELQIRSGAGTPEGSAIAPVGSLYLRTDGGAGTTLYVKESGTGNTGWVAK